MACGACAAKNKRISYVVTDANGNKAAYSSEVEARAAVARKGGSYKAE